MAKSKSKKNKKEILFSDSALETKKSPAQVEKIDTEPKKINEEEAKTEKILANSQKKQGTVKMIARSGYIVAPFDNPENLKLVSKSIGKFQVGDTVEF